MDMGTYGQVASGTASWAAYMNRGIATFGLSRYGLGVWWVRFTYMCSTLSRPHPPVDCCVHCCVPGLACGEWAWAAS